MFEVDHDYIEDALLNTLAYSAGNDALNERLATEYPGEPYDAPQVNEVSTIAEHSTFPSHAERGVVIYLDTNDGRYAVRVVIDRIEKVR